jgi:hypothetical protein
VFDQGSQQRRVFANTSNNPSNSNSHIGMKSYESLKPDRLMPKKRPRKTAAQDRTPIDRGIPILKKR